MGLVSPCGLLVIETWGLRDLVDSRVTATWYILWDIFEPVEMSLTFNLDLSICRFLATVRPLSPL